MNHEILPITIDAMSNNEPIRFDLTKAPYLLVSGASGQGKVKAIHTIFSNLLKLNNVDLLLIDPKNAELQEYQKVARRFDSTIQQAISTLEFLENTITERNKSFAKYGVKNIQEYNNLNGATLMKYMVLICDEFGDFSTCKEKNVIESEYYTVSEYGVIKKKRETNIQVFGDVFLTRIKRIAMIGRSAGIHLVLGINWLPVNVMNIRTISQYITCFEEPFVIDKVVEKHRLAEKLLEKERKKSLEKQTLQDLIDVGMIMQGVKREPIPRMVVEAIYSRDGGKCVFCGSTEKIQIDHIIPFSKGGSNEVENLQLLCQKCNLEKSNKI